MITTYQLMLPIATQKEYTEKQAIEKYKNDKDDIAFATIYVKHFPYMFKVATNFSTLDHAEIASQSLRTVDNCLNQYNSSTKFITYLSNAFRCNLLTLVSKQQMIKRTATVMTIDDASQHAINDSSIKDILTNLVLEQNLSKQELDFAKFIIDNPPSNASFSSDYAQVTGLGRSTVWRTKESIKNKLIAGNFALKIV